MVKKEIINDEKIKYLLDLVDVVHDADKNSIMYNPSINTSDIIFDLINKNKLISIEEKKILKSKFNKRSKNQEKVEELIKKIKNVDKGKKYF